MSLFSFASGEKFLAMSNSTGSSSPSMVSIRRTSIPAMNLRSKSLIVVTFLGLWWTSIVALLQPNVACPYLSSVKSPSSSTVYKFSVGIRPSAILTPLARNYIRHRRQSCLFGLDLFGLGAPEIVICGLAVAVLYGPDRIKGQLKDNGVKGQIVAEGWREEHNERIADVKKYAIQSRKKRAWKKINLAIENEDPLMLAKLAELDAKNPDTVKALSKSMDEEPVDDDLDDYDDDDDDDDDDDSGEVIV